MHLLYNHQLYWVVFTSLRVDDGKLQFIKLLIDVASKWLSWKHNLPTLKTAIEIANKLHCKTANIPKQLKTGVTKWNLLTTQCNQPHMCGHYIKVKENGISWGPAVFSTFCIFLFKLFMGQMFIQTLKLIYSWSLLCPK